MSVARFPMRYALEAGAEDALLAIHASVPDAPKGERMSFRKNA